jgi:hypothetical protein
MRLGNKQLATAKSVKTYCRRVRWVFATWAGLAVLGLVFAGCGGSSKKEDEQPMGSLRRTYTLVDEQGRQSGTLVLDAVGGAELRDSDGTLMGSFKSSGAAPMSNEPAEKEKKE